MSERRKRAIRRRRRFLLSVVLIITIVSGIIIFGLTGCSVDLSKSSDSGKTDTKKETSSQASEKKDDETKTESDENDETEPDKKNEKTDNGLDKKYSNYMLVNADNPLPDNYDSDIRKDLVEIDPELRNNNYVTKIHKSVYPYITAMVRAAQADGVNLKVWSPFRSYADQKVLFENQVARVGGDEAKAATVVARPGTSEHNTGICADFNMASDSFENTTMYTWMCEHAEEYGFILRYPKDKQDKTGVIYESWHWRFVGIDAAKKINKSGLCLEEYLEKNKIKQKVSIDNF
ncbi:MAG: D-alanyl-D-alanine carboxypeptidase family protein [Clostridia bacterium]|nr:D-alanyl-D-alanine carboxypeptidase family protein [Clostridia bacterium]